MAEEGRIGYLAVQTSADGQVFAGGLLTTNPELRPVDFRCTAPISPTPIQKLLYGEVLYHHLFIDLIGLPLVKAADPQPNLILFQKPEFLYLQKKQDKMPALWAVAKGETAADTPDLGRHPVDTQHLTITDRSGSRIGIFVCTGYGERIDGARTLLESVGVHFELLEPFRRMPALLEKILQSEIP